MELIGWQMIPAQVFLPGFSLQRSKKELLFPVSFHYELNRAIAQVAHSIEKNNILRTHTGYKGQNYVPVCTNKKSRSKRDSILSIEGLLQIMKHLLHIIVLLQFINQFQYFLGLLFT